MVILFLGALLFIETYSIAELYNKLLLNDISNECKFRIIICSKMLFTDVSDDLF